MNDRQPTVAVIGAGLAGTLVTANLLRYATCPLDIALVERSGDFGPGVAYSTTDPQHRLNVPAARMSAFQTAPLHLLTWASEHLGRPIDPGEYLPRYVYGEYLRALLADERARSSAARVKLISTAAERVVRVGAGALVELGDGNVLRADAVVLATGNLPPARVAELPDDPRVIADPWAAGALDRLGPADTTLVVGTSLTAIDVVLTTARRAPRGKTIAISRSGLVPFANLPGLREPAPSPNLPTKEMSLAGVTGFLRAHARRMISEGYDWRDVVDGIRPCVPAFWQSLPFAERQQFIAGTARGWDVRRHRIPPEANTKLSELRAAGRLEFTVGRIVETAVHRDCIVVTLSGHGHRLREVRAEQIVCCTGVGTEVNEVDGLIGRALDDGIAVADPLGLGLRAADCHALIDRAGSARGPIYTLGPPLRGELWETTAAREIRIQAEDVALELCRGLNLAPPATGEVRVPPLA